MADVQITQMSEASQVYGSDWLVLDRDGVAKKLLAQTLTEHVFATDTWDELDSKVSAIERGTDGIGDRVAQVESKVASLEMGGATNSLITKHPEDVVAMSGESVTLSVEVVPDSVKKYQWQYSTDNGVAWYNCTTGTYSASQWSTTIKASNDGRLYRCQVTGVNEKVEYSNPAEFFCSEAGYHKYPYKGCFVIETVLGAGVTSVEFKDKRITSDSNISIYTDDPQGQYTYVSVLSNAITIGFEARETDLNVKLVVM